MNITLVRKGALYPGPSPGAPGVAAAGGDRASASQLEARIKRLSRRDKQRLLTALQTEKRQQPLSVWIETLSEP